METTTEPTMRFDPSRCSTAAEWSYVIFMVIIACSSVPMLTWTTYRYYTEHKQQLLASPKYLYRSCMAFFIVCIIYMLSLFFANIFKCGSGYNAYQMVGQITGLTYVIHWALLIAIYLGRLHFVFRGTVLAIPKSHIWCFVGLSVLFVCLSGLVQLALLQTDVHVLLILGYILAFGTASGINTVLFSMFLHKLRQLIRITNDIRDKQQILDVMSKYTVLNLCTSFTTLLFLIVLCFMVAYPTNVILTEVANMLNVVDTYTDIFCMTLSFAFAKVGYVRLCGFCDRQLVNVCNGGKALQSLTVDLELQAKDEAQDSETHKHKEKSIAQESKSHRSQTGAAAVGIDGSMASDDHDSPNTNEHGSKIEGTTSGGIQFTIT